MKCNDFNTDSIHCHVPLAIFTHLGILNVLFHVYTNEILYDVYILFESDIEEKNVTVYFED